MPTVKKTVKPTKVVKTVKSTKTATKKHTVVNKQHFDQPWVTKLTKEIADELHSNGVQFILITTTEAKNGHNTEKFISQYYHNT